MLTRLTAVSAIALTCSLAAFAQTPTAPTTPSEPTKPAMTEPAKPSMSQPQAYNTGADAKKLIGRNIKNLQDETIGEIKSVHLDADGKVDQVIVSVGGFLGIGDREVAIAWKDLNIADDGKKVTVDMSKDQLKSMAEYRYTDPKWRGEVFTDRGPYDKSAPPSTAANPPPSDRTMPPASTAANPPPSDRTLPSTAAPKPADRATPPARTGQAFNANGDMSGESVIGATVRNANNESIGSINDIYLDDNGAVKTVIISVGGFLGMGSHDVAMKWSDLSFRRDGGALVVTTSMTKEALKAMPAYKKEQAQAPR